MMVTMTMTMMIIYYYNNNNNNNNNNNKNNNVKKKKKKRFYINYIPSFNALCVCVCVLGGGVVLYYFSNSVNVKRKRFVALFSQVKSLR